MPQYVIKISYREARDTHEFLEELTLVTFLEHNEVQNYGTDQNFRQKTAFA